GPEGNWAHDTTSSAPLPAGGSQSKEFSPTARPRAVPSALAVKKACPEGLNRTSRTTSLCTTEKQRAPNASVFHTCTQLALTVASQQPSGLNTADSTTAS